MFSFILFLLILSPFVIIYLLVRLDEYTDDLKTKRRYYDFDNIYYDYHHNIWVNKYVPETIPSIDITQVTT